MKRLDEDDIVTVVFDDEESIAQDVPTGMDDPYLRTAIFGELDDTDGIQPSSLSGRAPRPRAFLVRKKDGSRYPIGSSCVIGRGTRADIRIGDNGGISRMHVRIEEEDGAYLVTDLNSTNGTRVDGTLLTPRIPFPAVPGSEIVLSLEPFHLLVEEGGSR